MHTKCRALFAPLLFLALLLSLFSTIPLVSAGAGAGEGEGEGTTFGVTGTKVSTSGNPNAKLQAKIKAVSEFNQRTKERNAQQRGRSSQPTRQTNPSTNNVPVSNTQPRGNSEAPVPGRRGIQAGNLRTTIVQRTGNLPTVPTKPKIRIIPKNKINFANTATTATKVVKAQKDFKIRKIANMRPEVQARSEFQALRLPEATYGFELEGYHTDIFKYIKPKADKVTPAQKGYNKWTPQDRAENYLTQAAPKRKFNLGMIDISSMKERIEKEGTPLTQIGQFGDYEAATPKDSPFNKWDRIYTEFNDKAMWEIVSHPFDKLEDLFTNLVETMKLTGQKDRFFRVQINVFTENIPQDNWQKLVSLVASSNFALAYAGKGAAVRHTSNHYPSAEDFNGKPKEQPVEQPVEESVEESLGLDTLDDQSAPGMYDLPFEKMTGGYKTRLVAIRAPPKPENKKLVRIEFRAIPNERFGDCMIRHFLASAITEDDKINTFGECMKVETGLCSKAAAGVKVPTVSEVKEWSKNFPSNLDNVINEAQYNKVVTSQEMKKVVLTNPAWGTSTAADVLSTKDTAATLVPYVQCLLVTAAKRR